MFVKYILIQFHFINKEWSNCICVPFLHPLMKRFSEILINTCKAAIGERFVLSGQHPQSESMDDTYYSRIFYDNVVYCIKSVNSLFIIKNVWF